MIRCLIATLIVSLPILVGCRLTDIFIILAPETISPPLDELIPVTAENAATLEVVYRWQANSDSPLTNTAQVTLNPAETQIATGINTPEMAFVEIRNLQSGDLLARIDPELAAIVDTFAFSPDSSQIRAFGQDRYFIYDTGNGDLVESGAQPYFASTTVFNRDGSLALMRSASLDVLHVVEVATLESLVALDVPANDRVFSPDSTLFAYDLFDSSNALIAVHDTETGEHVFAVDSLQANPRQLALSADNTRLAYATDDTVTVIDMTTGEALYSVTFEGLTLNALTFGGDLLYVAQFDTLYVLDATGQILTQTATGDGGFIDDLTINADNRLIFGAAGQDTVLWGVRR